MAVRGATDLFSGALAGELLLDLLLLRDEMSIRVPVPADTTIHNHQLWRTIASVVSTSCQH